MAAEKLFLTQPAISTHVRMLEEELGVRLFDRIGKKVYLTQAGDVLFDYAERLLNLHDEAKPAVTEVNTIPKGKLLIGANESTCLYVLPQIFALFKKKYPEVQFGSSDQHLPQLFEEGSGQGPRQSVGLWDRHPACSGTGTEHPAHYRGRTLAHNQPGPSLDSANVP